MKLVQVSQNIQILIPLKILYNKNLNDHICNPQVKFINDADKNPNNIYDFKIIDIIENPFTYTLILRNPHGSFDDLIEAEVKKDMFSKKINDVISAEFKKEYLLIHNDEIKIEGYYGRKYY